MQSLFPILTKSSVNYSQQVGRGTRIFENKTHLNLVDFVDTQFGRIGILICGDLFCEKVLFTAQQGAELATIFEEAFNKYTINQTKLFRYASRRSQKKGISNYLNELNLIDD